jgi:hypothetical protein
VDALLDRCRTLAASACPSLGDMRAALEGEIDVDGLDALLVEDPTKPYGRRVLVDGPHMEMMIASWTRDVPCAAHDHGGSSGAVRVLRGEAVHTVWRIVEGGLEQVLQERVGPGSILVCGPDMVHSMVDGGAPDKLATLHLYADPIPFMMVYDPAADRTLQVAPTCGAWVPGAEQIVREVPGLLRRAAIA